MEQDLSHVKFSLRTKLLLSTVLLFIIVIAFLNLSTIIILREDKTAYIYQAQTTESVLAGREFVHLANGIFDNLRIALASIDPTRVFDTREHAVVDSILNNQSEILSVQFSRFPIQPDASPGKDEKPFAQVVRKPDPAGGSKISLKESDFSIPSDQLAKGRTLLLKDGYLFLNGSDVGGTQLLVVALADLKFKPSSGIIPVAFGFVSLADFLKDLRGSNFVIANSLGVTLFDTNSANVFSRRLLSNHPLFKAAAQTTLSTGAQEFSEENSSFLGSFYKPGLGLTVLSQVSLQAALRSAQLLTVKFLVLAGMAIGGAILFMLFFARRLTAPLKRLYNATKEVAAGNFNLKLDIKSRDEIGALSDSFSSMSRKIQDLISESMEKVRLEGELAVANAVQQALIPSVFHETDQFKIYSHYQSASECGGDWWGFFKNGNRFVIAIADATGHGVPSALITAAARSCFSLIEKLTTEMPSFDLSPSNILSFANRAIYDTSGGRIMMTLFVGVFDFDAKTFTYGSAGHNPPWYFRKSGAEYILQSLTSKGIRLGETRDNSDFSEKTVSIEPDDLLFLYTDGIIEGTNSVGTQYGKKQLRSMLERTAVGGPEIVVKSLMEDFLAHNGGKPLDDDVTLAVVGLKSKPIDVPDQTGSELDGFSPV